VLLIFDARGRFRRKNRRTIPAFPSIRIFPGRTVHRGIVEYHEIPGSTAIPVIILSLVIGITGFGMA
jgi:hypothetical protein